MIVHGCNCFCIFGAGIAKQIRERFPAAYDADLATEKGDAGKLGTCSYAVCPTSSGSVVVVNAYTQFGFAYGRTVVDYDAIESCFEWVAQQFAGERIGVPRIGAGLAGGAWPIIANIIQRELVGEDITLVELP